MEVRVSYSDTKLSVEQAIENTPVATWFTTDSDRLLEMTNLVDEELAYQGYFHRNMAFGGNCYSDFNVGRAKTRSYVMERATIFENKLHFAYVVTVIHYPASTFMK